MIYNGVMGFVRARQRGAKFARIGVLGRIAPEKGQLLFVEAARLAASHNPDLRFVVCGGPVLARKQYYDLVRDTAHANVTFLKGTGDVEGFCEQIDILVVPSQRVDANPRVIIEAFAAGVPVIAFESGGIAELVDDQITGILVRQHDTAALAAAILRAVQQSEQLMGIAEQAYAMWRSRFTLERFQSEVSDAIEAAVAVRRKTGQREAAKLTA